MSKSVVIELKNVKKTFKLESQEIEVLRGINLQVLAGEYVMFFGASGCGKSTLLNTICGLEPPTEGEMLIRGESLYKKSQHEITEYRSSKIGIVFQQFNLLKSLTIQENVALPLAASGEGARRRMERAAHLLEMVGLSKFIRRRPAELSGGQQQRVAIARALAVNPWIIICDEPTGNLDSRSANEIMEILARLNSKSKRTVLMVTHNPDYLNYPHRVIYMKDGQIEKEKINQSITTTDEIKDNEKVDLDLRDIVKDEENKEEKPASAENEKPKEKK